ncbi:hypothetical protein [Variovorax sp. PBL-E5]|uniref:hypothetical protein n=1 Tax=Variovorax sp. PBL-E5 TaxID=434014 RepID=UPI001317B2DD|nr:hypothetical protein [Variovorax sp. PBL-E5]VTU30140.1 hypothetical protein E5CHR_02954 [Variovorax sp. PBL-E5]
MTDHTPAAAPQKHSTNEEPEIGFEESIPSDGKDPVGEAMIDSLGKDKPENSDKAEKVPPSPPAEPLPEQLPVS